MYNATLRIVPLGGVRRDSGSRWSEECMTVLVPLSLIWNDVSDSHFVSLTLTWNVFKKKVKEKPKTTSPWNIEKNTEEKNLSYVA